MSENNLFTARAISGFEVSSAHFGVSVDNYISSMPLVGMEAVNIAQRGLAIGLSSSFYANSKVLFTGAYGENQSTAASTNLEQSPRTYRMPDEVCEFAAARNIEPLVIARVGAILMTYVSVYEVPLEKKMPIVRYSNNPKDGKLDSFLKLSLSPLNMIIPTRLKPTLIERFSHR
jgi:hypothetical protein